jgi:hypothetical protein
MQPSFIIPIEGHRLADAYNLALMADPRNSPGNWIAFDLADGRSDNILYPSEQTAAQYYSGYAGFMRIMPASITPGDAYEFIDYCRKVYPFVNPAETSVPLMPLMRKDQIKQVNLLRKKR